jgi:endonuclease YncB( thermonuclease family)
MTEIGRVTLVTVLDANLVQRKVRLAGIDAPELRQAFGARSKQHLATLAFRQQIEVEWHKRDRYGRFVETLRVAGVDVNLLRVEAGLAWHYVQYQREQSEADRRWYATAERAAREGRIGLWADAEPMAPWEYRRLHATSP